MALLAFSAVIFVLVTCKKKDDNNQNQQPTYTNGEGKIDIKGGTVTVNDASSPIYGASVYIPAGALTNAITIKISLAPDSVKLPTDSNAKVIEVQPKGLKFSVPIVISLPLHSGTNTSNLQAFYINPDSAIMEEVPIKEFISSSHIVKIQTIHFSCYAVGETSIKANTQWYYYNGKIHLNLYITRLYNNVEHGLNSIPLRNWWQLQGFLSAKDYIDNFCSFAYGCELISFGLFEVTLYRKVSTWFFNGSFDDKLETQKMYVLRTGASQSAFGAKVYTRNDVGQLQYFDNLQNSERRQDFFKGKALMFNFEYPIDVSHPEYEYYIKLNWTISQGGFGDPISLHVTHTYELNSYESPQKLSTMDSQNKDIDTNYIFDDYQSNPTNLPPLTPSNPSPANNTTNVSTSTSLSWTCSDPDQDPLTYDIYFGKSNNPSLAKSGITTTSYQPTSLIQSTTYHWKIVAKDNHGNSTVSPIWTFTTIGTGPNLPTVTTTAITNKTQTSATSGGDVTSDGGATVTTKGICWSTTINPTTTNNPISGGSGTGSYTCNITGLSPNTPYHVRAYATNSVGISYGEDVAFTTLPNPSGNLIAYYPFTGNANDATVNGYDGTIEGAILTTDRHGTLNKAYLFDGSTNDIAIPSDAVNNLPTGTVAAFIYLNELNLQHSILDKTETDVINYFQFIIDNNNKLRGIINSNGGSSYRSNTALSQNQWYHVAITWDGININFYLNGVLDGTDVFTDGVPSAYRQPYIGKVENNTAYMNGKIDEVRIYNYALTQSEIQSLANQ